MRPQFIHSFFTDSLLTVHGVALGVYQIHLQLQLIIENKQVIIYVESDDSSFSSNNNYNRM